jgi:hypothetical protein
MIARFKKFVGRKPWLAVAAIVVLFWVLTSMRSARKSKSMYGYVFGD